ncbi:polyketide cyclase [Paucibacter sp. KBW04]|uniref:SRPBCC family protein n=1 Tax=Paucibacter sp. KBW04 TaxID=2153361 RepID=UPI000F570E84|nr:SRPBCC family protein [Paucibacter sp. KBW04]RQO58793.1 polyketide cyclase [Paucibacter sp. KBW04]
MLKKLALIVGALLAALLVFTITRPDDFRVQREIEIKAPPEKIMPLLTDFKQFGQWSPWEHLDPKMQREFSGAPSGPGAIYAWQGNDDVGKGRMEILSATPEKVVIKLDFLSPFEAHNTAEYTLSRQGENTRMTWAMFGPANFLTKLMGVFISMDSMVGKDFEKGLSQIKQVAEKP